jgi:hypothetical protein
MNENDDKSGIKTTADKATGNPAGKKLYWSNRVLRSKKKWEAAKTRKGADKGRNPAVME